MSDATYIFSVSAFYVPIGESKQTATQSGTGFVSLSPSQFRFFTALPNTYISYFTQGNLISEGLAFGSQSAVTISGITGDYHLIGRKCVNDSSDNCELLYGSAKIQSDGKFSFCPQSSYSDSCSGKISMQTPVLSSTTGKFAFNPSSNAFGGLNAASTQQHGLAIYMNIGGSVYALFGHMTSYSAIASTAQYRVSHITSMGYVEENSIYSTTANTPLTGFSTSQSGEIILRSSAGLAFVGLPRAGARSATLRIQKMQ